MSVIIDSYSEANSDGTSNAMYATSSYRKVSQSFTPSDNYILDSSLFYLKKTGDPTGNAYARIYGHNGVYGTNSYPSSSLLATSDPFDVSTLTTTLALKTLTFSGANKIALNNGTHYCLVIEYLGGDSSNNVRAGMDMTVPVSHGGNLATYNGSSWWTESARDMIFYVYGTLFTDLTLQEASHVHSADNLILTQEHNLAIQDTISAHIADNIALTVTYVLAVQNALHGHAADNILLKFFNYPIIYDSIIEALAGKNNTAVHGNHTKNTGLINTEIHGSHSKKSARYYTN